MTTVMVLEARGVDGGCDGRSAEDEEKTEKRRALHVAEGDIGFTGCRDAGIRGRLANLP